MTRGKCVPISDYLAGLRRHVGTALILSPGVSAIVHDAQGDVLLQRRSDNGLWGLPGGSSDPGEEPARALVREVYEESGLLVIPSRLVGVFGGHGYRIVYPNGDQVEYTATVFRCRIVGGELRPRDAEVSELRFVSPAELPPLDLPYPEEIFRPELDVVTFQWAPEWLREIEQATP